MKNGKENGVLGTIFSPQGMKRKGCSEDARAAPASPRGSGGGWSLLGFWGFFCFCFCFFFWHGTNAAAFSREELLGCGGNPPAPKKGVNGGRQRRVGRETRRGRSLPGVKRMRPNIGTSPPAHPRQRSGSSGGRPIPFPRP